MGCMRTTVATRHARHALVALGASLVLLTVSCSTGGSGSRAGGGGGQTAGASGGPAATTTTTTPPVQLAANVGDKSTSVPLNVPLKVTAALGTLTKVTVLPTPAPAGAKALVGLMTADHRSWALGAPLDPGTTYSVTAEGVGAAAGATTKKWTFTTLQPTKQLHTRINVFDGKVYGVGMPLIVTLTSPIPKAKRAEVVKRLTVTTTPSLTGGWRWFSSSEVHWRPAVYWPAHTKASIKVDFAGLDLGGGVWGVDGRTISFSIGDSHYSKVDAVTHQMTVTVNGAVVKTMPVSTGRDKYPTKSGIHAVNDKEATKIMDSATVGIPRNSPDGYYETVLWDVRISNSGEFVHAAPWSTGSQGNSNVSHGCVNLSPADGQWFFTFTQLGDVVEVVNTPEQLQPYNGYGDWQVPWSTWSA
ncbi:MAG: ErfK/YbiS/YcfS/YnhG family protein [Acidimicrobiales bacterium]|nr:ErfK/YbiS/YcfS/YnhG family protein [Acidimicrobiales bacterium]